MNLVKNVAAALIGITGAGVLFYLLFYVIL